MSFQAYLDNIKEKTGKTAEEFKQMAKEKGLLEPGVKAGEIVAWLKKEYQLGHGHAMAIYASFKDFKPVKKKTVRNMMGNFVQKVVAGEKALERAVGNVVKRVKKAAGKKLAGKKVLAKTVKKAAAKKVLTKVPVKAMKKVAVKKPAKKAAGKVAKKTAPKKAAVKKTAAKKTAPKKAGKKKTAKKAAKKK